MWCFIDRLCSFSILSPTSSTTSALPLTSSCICKTRPLSFHIWNKYARGSAIPHRQILLYLVTRTNLYALRYVYPRLSLSALSHPNDSTSRNISGSYYPTSNNSIRYCTHSCSSPNTLAIADTLHPCSHPLRAFDCNSIDSR